MLGYAEHHQLTVLAMIGVGHSADDSDNLNHELDRARIVPDNKLPANVVRMGSIVTYRTGAGGSYTVKLAYPTHANDSAGSLSVLTPVGTALIGLATGQTISWTERNGEVQRLTVTSVVNPRGRASGNPSARMRTPALLSP